MWTLEAPRLVHGNEKSPIHRFSVSAARTCACRSLPRAHPPPSHGRKHIWVALRNHLSRGWAICSMLLLITKYLRNALRRPFNIIMLSSVALTNCFRIRRWNSLLFGIHSRSRGSYALSGFVLWSYCWIQGFTQVGSCSNKQMSSKLDQSVENRSTPENWICLVAHWCTTVAL